MKENVIAIIADKEKDVMKKLHLEISALHELKMSLGQSELTESELDEIKTNLNRDVVAYENQIKDWWDSILKKYEVKSDIDPSKIRLIFDSNELVV